jgi:hypothetical protein
LGRVWVKGFVVVLLIAVSASAAWARRGGEHCKRDADCRFAFRTPCDCPPCGPKRRRAQTRAAFADQLRGWSIKVPRCRPCKPCKQPGVWSGTRAVCRKGACAVAGDKPAVLKALGGVNVGGQVYVLEVVWRGGRFAPVKMPRMPYHHGSRIEWIGAAAGLKADKGQRHTFEFVVTKREIRKVPRRRQWRATYWAEVVRVR